jgi:hypothetical protein
MSTVRRTPTLRAQADVEQQKQVVARRWETVWVSLVLLTLLVVFFWKPLFLGLKLVPADIVYTDPLFYPHAPAGFVKPHNVLLYDQAYQFYPWRVLVSQMLRQGTLPFWNPYTYCGAPLLAEDQPAVFYPLNLLSYLFAPADAVLFLALARLFVAGLATYWFVRTLGGGRFGSLVGAVTFAFSGFMIVFLGHPHTNVVAWLPALFLTAEWLYRKNSAQHVAFIALVVAAQLTGGHTETALYTCTAGGLYYLLRVLCGWWQTRQSKQAVLALMSFAAATALGLALAAVHLLPFVEWLQHSAELRLRSGVENLSTWRWGWTYWLAGLVTGLVPNLFGNPTWPGEYRSFFPAGNYVEQTIYVGIIGLALAAVAAVVRRREKPVLFLTLLGVGALGAALRLPVLDWVNHLPVFDIASVGRLRLIYTFCASALAGLGAGVVLSGARGCVLERPAGGGAAKRPARGGAALRWSAALLVGLAAVAAAALVVARRVFTAMYPLDVSEVGTLTRGVIVRAFSLSNVMMYWPVLVALGGAVVLALYRWRVVGQRAAQAVLFILVVVDLFALGMDYHATIRPEDIYPETPALQRVKSDSGVFRVLGTHVDFMPNACVVYGLQDVRGLDFPIQRYLELSQAIGGSDWLGYGILFTEKLQPRLLNLMNVKYVLSSSRLGPQVLRDMELIATDNDVKVYLNKACLPRAFLVHQVQVVADGPEALRALLDPELDLGSKIVLEKAPPAGFVAAQGSPALGGTLRSPAPGGTLRGLPTDSVEIMRYTPNRVTIQADAVADGFLFLSDTYYPDWKAYVDGVASEIYPADYAFRAVYLTAGQHVVEFVYEPGSFRLAAAISLTALLTVVALLTCGLVRRHLRRSLRSAAGGSGVGR